MALACKCVILTWQPVGELSLLCWGGRLARERHKGRWGSCQSVADLPLCPAAPASHNAARDIREADNSPYTWVQQVPFAEKLP